jgi:RNA-directed DNA polymerase
MHDRGKSDRPVVPAKPPNKPAQAGAEVVEGRGLPEGNTARETRPGPSAGQGVSSDLDRVRQVARKDRDVRFTALLHHVDVDRLREAYRAISPNAAPGVDGVTWRDYGLDLEANLRDLHARVQRGAYRATASRRVFIPKPDGRSRPLGVAALEDKILQRAVVEVLNAVYEQDFLGFSYGFRPGRGQHDALDALAVAIERRRVNWVLDADIRDFFTPARSGLAGAVSRASDSGQTGPAADPEMAQGRSHRGRGVVKDRGGDRARGVSFAAACERLPALRL